MSLKISRPVDLLDFDALSVFEAFDEGVIITDDSGRIVFYNATQAQIDDMKVSDVIGKKVTEVYNLDESSSKIMRCLRSGRPIMGEIFFYRTRQGKLANTIHSVFPLHKNGRMVGVICFVKDYLLLERTITTTSRPNPHEVNDLGNYTRYRFTDIVGTDNSFLNIVKLARLAADSPSSIMLQGETGTGKEMFAQSIHNYSSRRVKRFVGINCAAIPENLLEGLLFGTAKGAFTGAVDKPGLFEQAHHSTLLLDEVDSMPLSLQAKILRVLQERYIRRVGGAVEIPVDIKIVSTVCSDPHRAIEEGKLRMDLYHRLAVVFIQIPPLRSLKGALEVLTRHFIYKYNLVLKKNVTGITREVMELFSSYPWPGNIRELEHVIEGAMNVIGAEDRIEVRHLPSHFISDTIGNEQAFRPEPVELPGRKIITDIPDIGIPARYETRPEKTSTRSAGKKSLQASQQEHEIQMITEALHQSGWNVAKAGRRLGVSRQLLYYKIRKHGIKVKTEE